jgi:iron complex outermembrane receptor protein
VSVTRIESKAALLTARTNASGDFLFADLGAGTYVVRAAPAGFLPTERRVTLNARGSARLDLELVLAVAEELSVVGGQQEALQLDVPSDAGSRLGLTPRELPSSLELVTQVEMEERGHRTVQEAITSAVGVTVGEHPADNASFTTRGFTQTQVPVLYEGIRVANAMAFPTDAWNLERLEVLKGPASALYGEGSVGGAINFLYKRPDRLPQRVEASVGYGSFNSVRLGLGAGGPLAEKLHYRIDYSLNQSDGFIKRTPSTLHNLTSALAWDVTPTFDLQISFDVQRDDFHSSYWGTPIVPASFAASPITGVIQTADNQTIDRRLSRINYDVADDVTDLNAYWTQAKAQWQPAPGISVRNGFYRSTSDREWKNAETYAFNAVTNQIDRDRFFVSHEVTLVGNRLDLSVKRPVGAFANRFLAGFEVSAMEFDRVPFYRGGVDTVDPLSPAAGEFGPLVPKQYTVQHVNTAAFFAEDYFSIRSDLKLATSIRAERIDADHKGFTFGPGESVITHPTGGTLNTDDAFGRIFTPVTFKVGLIYDVKSDTSLYGHYATAADPVNADLVYDKPANFDLAHGQEVEVGVKQTLARHVAEWTAAYYWIERRNLLTQTSPTSADAVGKQSSRGVELSLALRPIDRWQIQASAALLDARFDDFHETTGAGLVSRDGNRPPNIPNKVASLRTSFRFGDRRPLEVGAAYHYVGDRFNGLDNSVRMLGYGLVDAQAGWSIDRYRITARARNILNKDYAAWGSNYYTTQVTLGAPRSGDISLGFRF